MGPSSAEKEKKSRWRSMLGGGGGRDVKEDDSSHLRPGPSPKDSAYGSEHTMSDQPFARPQSAEPSETNVKEDPSTGNIVTTTVTTTTTTTTVTTGKGEHIKTESTPTVEADATARIRDSGASTNSPTPANSRPSNESSNQANSGQLTSQYNSGPNASNFANPAELDAPVPGGASTEDGPTLPTKSNRRISREMGIQYPRPISEATEPVSPIGSPSQHNFSYPARTPPPQQGQQSYADQQAYQGQPSYLDQQPHQGQQTYSDQQAYQGQQGYQGYQGYQDQRPYQGQPALPEQQRYQDQQTYQSPPSNPGQNMVANEMDRPNARAGTFQNLKTAAVGIHGAGETLRATFNSSIDKHVGRAPPERLAAHDQIAAAGASEIKTGRFYRAVEEERKKGGKGGLPPRH